MTKALDPLGDALELRAIRICFLLHLLLAIALCFIPLFDVLGFERAFATGLLATPTSAAVAIVMVKAARARGGDDLARVASYAVGISLLMLVPTLVAGVIVELIRQPCDQKQGILFLLLCSGGNAIFGAALGVAAGVLSTRRFVPALLVAAALLAFIVSALVRFYAEPQIFMYSLPFGYWPGSLYDEDLTVTGTLWIFRGYTVLVSFALIGIARTFSDPETLVPRLSRPRATALLGTAILVFSAAAVQRNGEALRFSMTRRTIERELSRHVETPHFDLFIAPSVTPEEVELIKEDHELRWTQLSRFFITVEPKGKIKSFVYADEKQKRRLMGAAGTQISRPWAQEIHINGFTVPHPVLKHELAHVFAGYLARGPFKVPASSLVLVNIGIVEGVAVAADWPANELSVHGWARAMRALHLAPDLRTSMSPAGFWSISSARAYTVAGSFVRFLVDRYGMVKLAPLYASNDFKAAYGKALDELAGEWEAFVDALPLPESDLLVAEHRFKQPGIFQKICAHKAANLARQGYERLSSGDVDGGIERLDRLISYSPGNVQPLLDISRALAKIGRLHDARRFAERALETPDVSPKSTAEAKELIAGLDWRAGALEQAKHGYEEVLASHLSTASDRLQTARLFAIDLPGDEAQVLRGLLVGDLSGPKALVKLGELASAHPKDGLVHYLYARQLENAGAYEEGIREVKAAIAIGLVTDALADEAKMMLGRMLVRGGSPLEAEHVFDELAAQSRSEVLQLAAEDWSDRAVHVSLFGPVRSATTASRMSE
jgi:hypothetical protein